MDDWLARCAELLGVPALDDDEIATLLDLTRDVAHTAERRAAPLTAFLVGAAVATSGDRRAALDTTARQLRSALEA